MISASIVNFKITVFCEEEYWNFDIHCTFGNIIIFKMLICQSRIMSGLSIFHYLLKFFFTVLEFSLYFGSIISDIPINFISISGYEWDGLPPFFSQQGSCCYRKAPDFGVLILCSATSLQEFISSVSFLMMFLGVLKSKVMMCMDSETLALFLYFYYFIVQVKMLNTILNKSEDSGCFSSFQILKNMLLFFPHLE